MLLSIIIPVYNVENYLNKCIQSIVNQKYTDLEIILVDDGSTDSSGYLCDDWAKKDQRISVVHKQNGGLSSARNVGLNIANGEFIGFVDSDDFVELKMYEAMMNAISETNKDIACCGRFVDLWGKREKIEYVTNGITIFNTEEALKETLLLSTIDVSSCDKIYRRKLFNSIRYPEGIINEDAAVIFNLISQSNGIVHVALPLYHYIYRQNSISKSEYNHKNYDAYNNCLNIQNFIYNTHPQLKKHCKIYCSQVCGNLLQSMSGNFILIKRYKKDFKDYKRMFNKGFWFLLLEKEISYKVKIKSIFVRLNIYFLFEKTKSVFLYNPTTNMR